jgi:hypothetical protein
VQPYLEGARVRTPDYGPGTVITDWRADTGPQQEPRDRVWVVLDTGHNPTPFRAAELQAA